MGELFCFVDELFVKLGDFWCAIVVADFALLLLLLLLLFSSV